MPIKLTLSPVSHLKIEMTRSRFTPCSKAPTLQTSSPDIPPDPPQHLLQVYVRTHLGLQSSAHHGPVPAEQLKHFCEYLSLQALHILENQVSTAYRVEQIKAKGVHCYKHSSPTTALVLEPCLFRLTSSDIKHQVTCRQ